MDIMNTYNISLLDMLDTTIQASILDDLDVYDVRQEAVDYFYEKIIDKVPALASMSTVVRRITAKYIWRNANLHTNYSIVDLVIRETRSIQSWGKDK
jgi:uncharacterized membrane protein